MRLIAFILCLSMLAVGSQPTPSNDYKAAVIADVNAMAKQSQVMVDMVFSSASSAFRRLRLRSTSPAFSKKRASRSSKASPAFPPRGSQRGARAIR